MKLITLLPLLGLLVVVKARPAPRSDDYGFVVDYYEQYGVGLTEDDNEIGLNDDCEDEYSEPIMQDEELAAIINEDEQYNLLPIDDQPAQFDGPSSLETEMDYAYSTDECEESTFVIQTTGVVTTQPPAPTPQPQTGEPQDCEDPYGEEPAHYDDEVDLPLEELPALVEDGHMFFYVDGKRT